MIATSVLFWKAFFDPTHVKHSKARQNLAIYDKEKIIIDQITLSEVVNWLSMHNKQSLIHWFLEFARNTATVRLFYFGKEEMSIISDLCITHKISFSDASLLYLQKYLKCDVTSEFNS